MEWIDKVDGVDVIYADDINSVAHEVIRVGGLIGDIDTALDSIIALEESYFGGDSE